MYDSQSIPLLSTGIGTAVSQPHPLSPVMEELEEPSARLELPPPRRLDKVKDRGWRSDENKIFDGGGGKHTHTHSSKYLQVS